MFYINILGGIGAVLSMVGNVPQAWKVRHANTTRDLHSYSIILHFTSACIWSAYGFLLDMYILGIESGIVAVLYFFILLAIIRDRNLYRNRYQTESPRVKDILPVTQTTPVHTKHTENEKDTI